MNDRIIITLTDAEIFTLCRKNTYKQELVFNGHIGGHLGADLEEMFPCVEDVSMLEGMRWFLIGAVRSEMGVTIDVIDGIGSVWAKYIDGRMVPVKFVRA